MGCRAAICGRRGLPNAKRALYFGRLRNAVSNPHNNSNSYADYNANANANSDSECNTQPQSDRNTYRHTRTNASTSSDAAATAHSEKLSSQLVIPTPAQQRDADVLRQSRDEATSPQE
jgi:hypothetical protein